MGQRLIITEEERNNIRFLYEQRTSVDIDYSFIIGKEYSFYNDRKEGKQDPVFTAKIEKVESKVQGVATGLSHILPGESYHEYKIYQFLDVRIVSSNTNIFKVGSQYRFIYICEYRSFKQTTNFQTTGQGKYYESSVLTKELTPICSDPDMRTSGIIKFPR